MQKTGGVKKVLKKFQEEGKEWIPNLNIECQRLSSKESE